MIYDHAYDCLQFYTTEELVAFCHDEDVCDSWWFTAYEILRQRGHFA